MREPTRHARGREDDLAGAGHHAAHLTQRRDGDVVLGDPIDLTWARRFSLWTGYALGQPLPLNQVGTGRNAFTHESGIHADGVLKDHGNYELYDEQTLGPFPSDWHVQPGRVVLTGEYGGKAGFRHVVDGCNAMTGRPLTDDELRPIASYPRQLALLFPGLIPSTSRSAAA